MEKESMMVSSDPESRKIILPRDVFRSPFTYGLYIIRQAFYPMITLVVLTVCFSRIHRVHHDYEVFVTALIYIAVFVGSPIWLIRKRAKVFAAKINEMRLLDEILYIRPTYPSICSEKWDLVAARMNSFLHESGSWSSPYYFYDGQACFVLYRMRFMLPYLKREMSGNEPNNEANNNSDDDEVSSLLDDAMAFYRETLGEEWQKCLRDSEVAFQNSEMVLPRDCFKNKLTYFCYTEKVILCIFLLFLTYSITLHSLCFSHGASLEETLRITWYSDWLTLSHIVRFKPNQKARKENALDLANRMKFLALVVKFCPGNDTDKWDVVAIQMNEALSTSVTRRSSPYFFYDGKSCRGFFKKMFVDPRHRSKFSSLFPNRQDDFTDLSPFVEEAVATFENDSLSEKTATLQ